MKVSSIALVAGLVLALLALFAWALPNSDSGGTLAPHRDAAPVAALEDQIAALRAELADARDERLALSEEVGFLRAELDLLASPADRPQDTAVAASDPYLPETREPAAQEPSEPSKPGIFNEASLLELGLSASEISRLREIFESEQMEELYLRDRAAREGWLNKPRFAYALGLLQNKLRDGLSDDDFDRMLYASGKHNRAVLTHVLNDSPAQDAGLKAGDVVLSYDDVRIFKPTELQRATTTSTPGLTPMIVKRNGETLRVFVPAGPLGVQLEKKIAVPEPY